KKYSTGVAPHSTAARIRESSLRITVEAPSRLTALATSIAPTGCCRFRLPASPDTTQRSAPSSNEFRNSACVFRAPIPVTIVRISSELFNRLNGTDSARTAKVTIILGNFHAPQLHSRRISVLDVPAN